MNVNGKHYYTIWIKEDQKTVQIIDQRSLPYEFIIEDLKTVDDVAVAIKDMHVRGAPLIGVTAAFGMYLACLNAPAESFEEYVKTAAEKLKATRPTAIDLNFAIEKQLQTIKQQQSTSEKIAAAFKVANEMHHDCIQQCKSIGEQGLKIIEEISKKKNGKVVNILTHCNAGWLACVDYGTATAPIYAAIEKGIKIHVWVDETRPRNQGLLTAWELMQQGVPHTVIADNCGGHLMQHGQVDMVIVGTDRTTRNGDVANKIGTYLKALAAKDNNVPFYAAVPSSTFDFGMYDGVKEIPIEERSADEVKFVKGLCEDKVTKILVTSSPAANYGFDVTPARLVTGLITEKGICEANEKSIINLFPK